MRRQDLKQYVNIIDVDLRADLVAHQQDATKKKKDEQVQKSVGKKPKKKKKNKTHREIIILPEQYCFKTDKDVLFGRGGTPTIAHNAFFRKQVRLYRDEYFGTTTQATKARATRRVYDWVHANGGRFLRRINNTTTNNNTDSSSGGDGGQEKCWYQVTKDDAIGKIQQTFRDMKYAQEFRDATCPSPV